VREGDHAVIEIHDNGLGMSDDRLQNALSGGIGLSNVDERPARGLRDASAASA